MSELESDAARRYASKVDCEGGAAGGVPTAGEIRADGMADGRLDAWGLTSWALAKTSVKPVPDGAHATGEGWTSTVATNGPAPTLHCTLLLRYPAR